MDLAPAVAETEVERFCKDHRPLLNWAIENGCVSLAELWEKEMDPEWRLFIATRPGVFRPAVVELFMCFCVAPIQQMLVDKRSYDLTDCLEAHAHGRVNDTELYAARQKAWAAVDAVRRIPNKLDFFTAFTVVQPVPYKLASLASSTIATATVGTAGNLSAAVWPAYKEAEKAGCARQARYLRDLGNPFTGGGAA